MILIEEIEVMIRSHCLNWVNLDLNHNSFTLTQKVLKCRFNLKNFN